MTETTTAAAAAAAAENARQVADELGIDDGRGRVRARAADMADRYEGEVDASPETIGAASVFLATQLYPTSGRSQREVAEAAGITPVELSACYHDLAMAEWSAGPDDADRLEADDTAVRSQHLRVAAGALLFVAAAVLLTSTATVLDVVGGGAALAGGAIWMASRQLGDR